MTSEKRRFAVCVDPADLWTVWDDRRGEPAALGDGIMIGLTRTQARDAARRLNAPQPAVNSRSRAGSSPGASPIPSPTAGGSWL